MDHHNVSLRGMFLICLHNQMPPEDDSAASPDVSGQFFAHPQQANQWSPWQIDCLYPLIIYKKVALGAKCDPRARWALTPRTRAEVAAKGRGGRLDRA